MLQIITNGYESPDGTYFRTAAAEPELERSAQGEQVLKLVNGRGTRRSSWGEPGVNSSVILGNDDLVAIHVGFFHKHGGGQFYRYYRFNGEAWTELTWPKLSDEERMRVLDAYADRAPKWAKVPGKLRKDYATPVLQVQVTHKIVRVVNNQYRSVYDPSTTYELGKRLAQKALEDHRGGYYSYTDMDTLLERFYAGTMFPEECYEQAMELAVIECEISGTMILYESGKIASTYLKPIGEVSRFQYAPAMKGVC